jgi:K+-transporting ATPase ATPase B chain
MAKKIVAAQPAATGEGRAVTANSSVECITLTPSTQLRKGDMVIIEKGDVVPTDAEVTEGIAMVDESLLTGESAAVRKGTADALIGGSMVVSDSLKARITVNPEESFINQMIKLVESSKRPKTPNEQALTILLVGLTAIFTIIVMALLGLSIVLGLGVDLSVLIALYVCLLPTTIGALLPAIGISGISRLYAKKIVAKSGRAIETAGDVDTIMLDKTGTITVGNRRAVQFIPFEGHSEEELGKISFLASWGDDTPEGRSIIELAYQKGFIPHEVASLAGSSYYEFSAISRTSGTHMSEGSLSFHAKSGKTLLQRGRPKRKFLDADDSELALDDMDLIKGAPDAMKAGLKKIPGEFDSVTNSVSSAGDTAIAVTKNGEALGIIRLKDVLKPGMKDRINALKSMAIKPIMITGDHPVTARSIAAEVGIDEFVPQAKPEDKYRKVIEEREQHRIVAMIGDGSNDAPALAIADVGLAMNSGTAAAKEAANMVDLESDPSKIIDAVMVGKQLLMTRGAVTTFSIANDVAKYFAIVPVMFATIPALHALNILNLGIHTAVLSALIFNAVIIPLLIPLAMKGVSFKPASAMTLFLKNTITYGIGGIIIPFAGIKLIDIALGLIMGR